MRFILLLNSVSVNKINLLAYEMITKYKMHLKKIKLQLFSRQHHPNYAIIRYYILSLFLFRLNLRNLK